MSRSLTPAQVRVAVLVAAGLSNPEIARQTGSAESTIKNHLNALYHNSPAVNRDELIAHYHSGTLALGSHELERHTSSRERAAHYRSAG